MSLSLAQRALALRRLRYRHRVRGSTLQRCWDAAPSVGSSNWRKRSLLACDAEMSSLDPRSGELLSLGWVAIDNGAIPLASAEHHLVRPQESVGQSATIHHLRDCEFDQALPVAEVMERFLSAARGRLLVFHNATLDVAFLDGVTQALYGAPLLLPRVDTMALEQRLLTRGDMPLQPGALRLATCRQRYNLPPYAAHNALADALATAELLLAQLAGGASL